MGGTFECNDNYQYPHFMAKDTSPGTISKDVVCGMDASDSSIAVEHGGTVYRFCSAKCRDRFVKDPEEFIEAESKSTGDEEEGVKKREEGRGSSWKDYLPLMVIIALALLAACARQAGAPETWTMRGWMHDFMGFFLVIFSMFKFFDLEGFADGFQMYDLLAKPFRPYAFVYPFLELGLGLAYLARWQPVFVYGATVVLMLFGALGVLRGVLKGLDLECACMGTVLRVPLSTVALLEDGGMALMAGVMLFMRT